MFPNGLWFRRLMQLKNSGSGYILSHIAFCHILPQYSTWLIWKTSVFDFLLRTFRISGVLPMSTYEWQYLTLLPDPIFQVFNNSFYSDFKSNQQPVTSH